jgi:predicted ATP-binding protein involved in virulence
MKIDKITLKNYRCFSELSVDFHPNLTVLVANNGHGKTTILDALRVAIWPFLKSFELAQSSTFNDPSNGISISDAKLIKLSNGSMARQLPVEITSTGDIGLGDKRTWTRSRISEKPRTKTRNDDKTRFIEAYSSQMQDQIRNPNAPELDLPMLGYYGTGRLWAQKRLSNDVSSSKRDDSFFVRSFGYQNCMDPASSYKHFREWFVWAWKSWENSLVRSSSTQEEKESTASRIKLVQSAVDLVLKDATGWHTLEYSVEDEESLVLSHPSYGRIKVDQMSDGIRSIVALVGDIAYRSIKLNPQLKSDVLKEIKGVVLIDEVDMHLHPKWQQTVIGSMREAFPNIQFIVTTHSPQVLSTVPAECIRVLKHKTDPNTGGTISTAEQKNEQTIGIPSSDILIDYQEVNPIPPVEEAQWIADYSAFIEQGQHQSDLGKALRKKLIEIYGESHRVLLDADKLIRFQSFKQKSKKD